MSSLPQSIPTDSPAVNPAGSEAVRPPLHWLETALVIVSVTHLCFLPWALGTMHVWSQLTSLVLSSLGFVLAAAPRFEKTSEGASVRWPVKLLFRSPIFWIGLVFPGYIVLQGSNPAWQFQQNETSWWLTPLHATTGLPSGVEAPFDRSNPWRFLTVFLSLFLLASSIWAGFTRRKSYHALFVVLSANACLLAIFGLIERVSGTARIFGAYLPSNHFFVASFIYPNHAGCYFYLLVSLCVGLAWWHYQRTRKHTEGPGPALTLTLFTVFNCGLVIISFSRVSITLLVAFFAVLVSAVIVVRLLQKKNGVRRRMEIVPIALILAAFVCTGLVPLSSETIRNRFSQFASNPTAATEDRSLARRAALAMFRDHWVYGWGAGCFRYGFTKYTKPYPEIYLSPTGQRLSWEHAHNDVLEYLCEFGVVGILPLLLIAARYVWQLWRKKIWNNIVSLSLSCAIFLVVLHSSVDFVFQCPAILLTWGVLAVAALRWTTLDRARVAPPAVTVASS